MNKSIFIVSIILMAITSPIFNAKMVSNITCEEAKGRVKPCFIENTKILGVKSSACCNALLFINSEASTGSARKDLCKCFQDSMKPYKYKAIISSYARCHIPTLDCGRDLDIPWDTRKLKNMDQRLFDAACTGDITTLEFLLQEDPLLLDRLSLSSQENPLHVSAFSGQAAFTAEILRLKPGLAMELNQQGFNPLHIASASGEVEVVREILRVLKREDVCLLKDKDGLIPLHCAAQRGRINVIKELVLSFHDSLKEATMVSRETALHLAVKNNHAEATKLLLEEIKKHDMAPDIVNWENQEGNTALHLATLGKNLQIVEMLIGEEAIIHGVDANIQNGSWLTPKDILDLVLETEEGNVSKTYKLSQIFQKSEAKNGKKKRKALNHPPSTSKSRWRKLRDILDWEIKVSTSDQRETLVVVATLIASLTFAGMLQPPGGFRGEDNNNNGGSSSQNTALNLSFKNKASLPGRSIMARKPVLFSLYAVFNAIGFFASISMISQLTRGFPLRNWMRLCIISMVATYIITIFYIAPTERILTWVVVGGSALVVLGQLVLFIKWLHKVITESSL